MIRISQWLGNSRMRHWALITLLLAVCGLVYYSGELSSSAESAQAGPQFFNTVHDLHRLFFLIPILYAGYMLRIRGALVVVAVTTAIILPRALMLSPFPDPLLRTIGFVCVAALTGVLTGISRNQVELSSRLAEQQNLLVDRLRVSELKYRDLFQKARDAIWVTDMNGTVTSANNVALAFEGFNVEDLSHTREDTVLTEESLHKASDVRRKLLEGSNVEQPYEQRLITRDGEEVILMVTASVVYSSGKATGFEYIARDITRQKKDQTLRIELEREVRSERDKLFGILENIQDGVFITDADLRIKYMNTSMIREFGSGAGRYCYEHLAGREIPCTEVCGLGTVAAGEISRWECTFGDGRTFEVVASPFLDEDDSLCQLATLRNITERKRLENELIKLNQLKTDLLSNVSHELKTPLTSIKGIISSLLQKDIEWDAQTVEMLLNGMSEETDRLTSLVTNLLNMSKLESGVWQPDLAGCDIADTIMEAIESQRWIHRNRVYEEAVATDLPPVWADTNQVRQVINNLLENAAAYSEDDTVIKVTAEIKDEMVEISVTDQGTGIPSQEFEQIFEKFYRGSYKRRSPGGTGLGLAICRAIVENHGGAIWVESQPGSGSTFHFTLRKYQRKD